MQAETRSSLSFSDGDNTFTAIATDALSRSDTNSVTAYLPATNTFAYDLNGNLLSDGKRAFEYDDENELIQVTATNQWRTQFTYDGKGRMRIRKEFKWVGGSFILSAEVRYVYDGNLVIQERDQNNTPRVSYTRGADLSGSFQGAGGIGGLLARTDNSVLYVDPAIAHAYYHADGNGNITALLNSQQGFAAKYNYDPFGNILSQSGLLADANACRFSSKESIKSSGLIYYLYRFYSPTLQRWLNWDPIAERGGVNLYKFVHNSPADRFDCYGLDGGATAVTAATVLDGPGVAPVPGMTTAAELAAENATAVAALSEAEPVLYAAPALLWAVPATLAVGWVGEKSGFTDKLADWLVPQPVHDPTPLPRPVFPKVRAQPAGPAGPPRKPPGVATTAPCGGSGDNEGAARGREAHKWWQPPPGYVKDWRFSTGETADALNPMTKHILELKTSPAEVAKGWGQIRRYTGLAEREIGPGPWTGDVIQP